jgi:hypothetical protein
MPILSDKDLAIIQQTIRDVAAIKRWQAKFKIEGPLVTGANTGSGAGYLIGTPAKHRDRFGPDLVFAHLTGEDSGNPGAYSWERVTPARGTGAGGDSDLGGFWKRAGEASVDGEGATVYPAHEANGQESILTLYTNLGLTPVFQMFPAGKDTDGNKVYVFNEPYIAGDEELWIQITGSTVVVADSQWHYGGPYVRWDGTDWQNFTEDTATNILNTYEPVIGGTVYTNGVDPADISGTSIVPQPVAPGVYRLHRVPIYDTDTHTSITGYTFMISEPNGMSGACS